MIDHLPFVERRPLYGKAIKRLLLLCFFGVLYNHGWGTGVPFNPEEVRYASVLGRIAVAWFIAAMLVWHTSFRTQMLTLVGILIGYWVWLCFIPVPGGVAGDITISTGCVQRCFCKFSLTDWARVPLRGSSHT